IDNLEKDRLFSPKLTVLWHSGEPLVPGIDFYRKAFDLISYKIPRRITVMHSIVTNGTLLDDRWAEFLLENGVRVGVSCDGPEFLHNLHRKTRSGKGTHERVMRGIKVLQKHGIDFYILAVLSSKSLGCAEEILQFARDKGIQALCFNIEETEGVNVSATFKNEGLESRVRAFFEKLLDHSFNTPETPWIRELDEMFPRFFGTKKNQLENYLTEPFRIITVDASG